MIIIIGLITMSYDHVILPVASLYQTDVQINTLSLAWYFLGGEGMAALTQAWQRMPYQYFIANTQHSVVGSMYI